MVLQMEPSKAAVYGFAGEGAKSVSVTVSDATGPLYTVRAELNATHQPFGASYGPRPSKAGGAFNPWNRPLPSWKALLRPTAAGGNYTVAVRCDGCAGEGGSAPPSITNVTFGDVWYCSGQSNMWLPVSHTYARNDTVAAIRQGKLANVRLMAGSAGTNPYYPQATKSGPGPFDSGYGSAGGSNPWMTAAQAVATGNSSGLQGGDYPLFQMGAACWYFAQRLSELGVPHPIGIANTAIGGQRIEQYANNATIAECGNRTGDTQWDAGLFATQVLPFVDMTVKGWVWYQGENNMGGVKGNADARLGYSCMQRSLIQGWRKVWSETPGTTDPLAPFGVVTLASSGTEGGPNMGAMRLAQTGGFGVLPSPELPNTFLAQAYDLDDQWGAPSWGRMACHFNHEGDPCFSAPFHQPCFVEWACCPVGAGVHGSGYNATTCNATAARLCANACAVAASTPEFMGGIHPRSKKRVGDRLGDAAHALVYGSTGAFTGPTLSGCSLDGQTLTIEFNATLLRGGALALNPIKPASYLTGRHTRQGFAQRGFLPDASGRVQNASYGGSTLFVQTNASLFCVEPVPAYHNATTGAPLPGFFYCPEWAGGVGPSVVLNTTRNDSPDPIGFDSGWVELKFALASDTAIEVDLSPLRGATPTAVRYAWGALDCCDLTDPLLWVTHDCIAECPIYSSGGLPANPFLAKIVGGRCECVAPQKC